MTTETPQQEMLIVTGMSGAGRSTVGNALEDLGWYVVDNLPPQMLGPLVELPVGQPHGRTAEPRPDHARYVAHWLDLLRADRRAVFTAASKAQAAADWLLAAAAGGAAAVTAAPRHGAAPADAPAPAAE